MLEYDLNGTAIFKSDSAAVVPTEAEMFVITLALLLVHKVAYSEMASQTLEFEEGELERVAVCIEEKVPLFTRDMGLGQELRQRLSDFVGLRISCVPLGAYDECRERK